MLSNKDQVSIIIPVYNAEQSIELCLESIINQTYNNIEIILVNDGSTDNSKNICEIYAIKYDNIKLINQENSGPSAARNKGIEVSGGEYIQFVDSDDKVDINMTEKLVSGISDEIQLVICGYRRFYIESGIKRMINRIPSISGIKCKEEFIEVFGDYFEDWLINSPCNKLYISNIIKNEKCYFDSKISIGEDLLFNLKYINKCKNINIIKDVLYNYIALDNGSLTRSYQKDRFKNQKMLFTEVRKFLKENNSYHMQNKFIIDKMYSNSIILCFENIINLKNDLKYSDKINEIKNIIRDKSVENILENSSKNELPLQNRIMNILLKMKQPHGIYVYFIFKKFIRNYFQFIFRLIKKQIVKI